MRYLLLSDVHANAGALEAVLAHAHAQGWDTLISLGDSVGYGTEPDATLDRLRSLSPYVALRGNHEEALLRALSGAAGQQRVAPNYERTREQAWELSEANRSFVGRMTPAHLETKPDTKPNTDTDTGWGAVHGALRDPLEYLLSVPVARANEPLMTRPLYFVGHTHIPGIFVREAHKPQWHGLVCRSASLAFTLEPGSLAFVNPGSVGQPRDELGSSYAIYDDALRLVTFFRLAR